MIIYNMEDIKPIFSGNSVAIVISSSNEYAPYAGVLIKSIIINSKDRCYYDIIVLERDITDINKQILVSLGRAKENISIRFVNPVAFFLQNNILCSEEYIPLESWFRLIAPFVLHSFEKIITVDCDMLLRRDIADLYNENLGDAVIAGARDLHLIGAYYSGLPFKKTIDVKTYNARELKLHDFSLYINAGLMIIDCRKFCSEMEISEIQKFVSSHSLWFAEQDVINCLLEKRIVLLEQAWNVMIPVNAQQKYYLTFIQKKEGVYSDMNETLKKTCIYHWPGRPKPWICPDVPFGAAWWEIAQETPFMGHIIARMIDGIIDRKHRYSDKYGIDVASWNPIPPNVERNMPR